MRKDMSQNNPYIDQNYEDRSSEAVTLMTSIERDIQNDPQYYAEILTDMFLHWKYGIRETEMMWNLRKVVDEAVFMTPEELN
jgi:hypothetical protein